MSFNKLLICFHVASGLKVNLQNSKVYGGGVEDNKIARLVDILKCWACFPLVYLGLPVGDNMKLSRYWDPVVTKIGSKLSAWKAKNFSFGGILTLVKFVLTSIPLYYFSLFKGPKKLLMFLKV